MNVITAVLFFIAAFMWGVAFPPAQVGGVSPDSPAATTPAEGRPDIIGLAPGDRILSINGHPASDFTDKKAAPERQIHVEHGEPLVTPEGEPTKRVHTYSKRFTVPEPYVPVTE